MATTLEIGDAHSQIADRTALAPDLRLELRPGADVVEIARPATAERTCCRFFDFALTIDTRGIAIEVHAPPEGQPVLAGLSGTADVPV